MPPAAKSRNSSSRPRKRQTTLLFSPLPSSSPAKDHDSKVVQGSSTGPSSEAGRDSPDPISLLSPESSSAPQGEIAVLDRMSGRRSFPSPSAGDHVRGIPLSDDTDEDDLITPAQKRRKTTMTSPYAPTPDSRPQRRSKRLHQGSSPSSKPRRLTSSEDEVSDLPSSPARRRAGRLRQEASPQPARRTRSAASQMPLSSDTREPTLSDLGSPENSDDDNLVMATKPTIRRKSKLHRDESSTTNDDPTVAGGVNLRGRKRVPGGGDDFVVDDDDIEYISSEDEAANTTAKKSATSHRVSSHRGTPAKRKARTQEEQDELEDDLYDLQDSDDETPMTKSRRTRGGPVTTQRDSTREHFELLRRRRAGEKITREEDSDEETDQEVPDADLDLIGEPRYGVSDHSVSSDTDLEAQDENGDQEEEDDDFIEDDTQGRLGRPISDIPLQFTSFASKKPKELFIHIIEWIVKNKIAPAFNRDDPVYGLAFARVDDQVKAQAGSRLISAAWGNNFKHAILARPQMKIVALPGEDEEHMRNCDACNRTNNPARYEFVFTGEPYHAKTLEPVDSPDDDEDDLGTNSDSVTYDEAGHVVAHEDTRFYLGRFCAANAEMGHKLTHWKHHLNESLMNYLESQGVLSPDSILAREKMNKKKREKQAEDIVDEMEGTGIIAEFWSEFQNDLNDARLGMVDYERKGGRTKGRAGAIRAKRGGLVMEWDKDKVRVGMAIESDSDEY